MVRAGQLGYDHHEIFNIPFAETTKVQIDENKVDWKAESFAADSSERCFACGCAGDGKGDNPGRNELIYCDLCEDSWCDCCREPSCADKHEWYFCTRNAAESHSAEGLFCPSCKDNTRMDESEEWCHLCEASYEAESFAAEESDGDYCESCDTTKVLSDDDGYLCHECGALTCDQCGSGDVRKYPYCLSCIVQREEDEGESFSTESKIPPAEKAGITGITSGATMEGLETLLATEEGELCPDCADRCTHEDVAEIEVTDTTVEEDGVSIDVKCSCGVIGYVYGGKYDWDDWHEDTRLQHRPTFVSSAGFPGGRDDTGRPFQCPRCSGRFASETLLATDTFASMEWDEQNYAEGWYEDVAEGEGPEGLYIDLYVLNNPSKGTSLSEDISLTAYEWWEGLSDEEMDKVFADRKAEPIVLEWYVDSIPDYYYEPDDSDDTWGAEGDLEETQEELAEVRTELSKSRTGMSLIRTGLAIAGFVLLWEHHKWAKEEHDSKENRV